MRGVRIIGGIVAAVALAAGPVATGAAALPPVGRDIDHGHAQEARHNIPSADRARLAAQVMQVGPRANRLARPEAAGQVPVVVEGPDPAALDQAVSGAGGRVTRRLDEGVSASVPVAEVAEVGRAPGVERAWVDQAPIVLETSEGTRPVAEWPGATNASAWHGAVPTAYRGAGVKIGIIDVGFGGLVAAGADRPPTAMTNDLCDYDGFDELNAPDHGTAVLEVVYDMAPDADYVLVCIDQESDLEPAVDYLHGEGVRIVNMSLGFTDGRGDGSAFYTGQAAEVVERSRLEYGMLWTVAAGNQADAHYMVRAGDTELDGFVEIVPGRSFAGELNEIFLFAVGPHETASIDLRWDSWYGAPRDYDLYIRDAVTGETVAESYWDQTSGATPWEGVTFENTLDDPATYFAEVVRYSAPTTPVRFDFFAFGAVMLEATTPEQSVTEPATSPYAMAVGAHCFQGTDPEAFSSRGPTIDGRIKPDISAPDGVATVTAGPAPATCAGDATGFFGTSAAAPHVAGAAAVLLSANPALDPTQLQALLEANANGTPATDPQGQTNDAGWGVLTLPATTTPPASPVGARYTGLNPPIRLLDTRAGSGSCAGPCAPIGPGQTRNLDVVGLGGLPSDTTAAVLNVTAVSPTSASHLTVFPAGQAVPRVANLNFTAGQVAGNHVSATIGLDGEVSIFNAGGQVHVVVDLAGFYSPSAGMLGLEALTPPVRIMDTRTGRCVGPQCGMIGPGQIVELPARSAPGVLSPIPSDAQAVVLNVTGVKPTSNTHVTVWPEGAAPNVASLNLARGAVRGNLVVATIGANGNVRIRNAGGHLDLVVDVMGWFDPDGAAYVALNPRRVLDTRSGNGRFGALGAGAEYDHQSRLVNSVPADATAALMNVTVVSPSGAGHLTIFPDGVPTRPGTANLNFVAREVVPNAVVSAIGTTGRITIFNNNTSPATPVVVDLAGYFVAP